MKRMILCLLAVLLLLSGCGAVVRDVTCGEIVAAYEEAGYEVFHQDPSGIDEYDCYIKVEDKEAGRSIYFHRFPTAIEAQSRADARQYNVLIWLFSVIYGDPLWVHTTTYGCYEIEYDSEELYEPFEKLIH